MKPLAIRLLLATAALPLAACFGTGVAPAKNATLSTDTEVALSTQAQSALVVRNDDLRAAVARHVRLYALSGAAPLADVVEVTYGADCDALAPGGSCTIAVQPAPYATADDFPLTVEVGGDNTNRVQITLMLGTDAADAPHVTLHASPVRLDPPAPASATLLVQNFGNARATLLDVAFPPSSGLLVDPTACPGYPVVQAGGNCPLTVRAPTDATPGAYAVVLTYEGPRGPNRVVTTATVAPGPLVVNDGAPIGLDGNASVVAVTVRNAGFDLTDVAATLPWSDECRGQPSLTLDATGCTGYLAANAQCTLRLTTFGATPGVNSTLTVTGQQGAQVQASQPVRISSLLAHGLHFGAPGTQSLRLDNLTGRPLSVVAVRVGGNHSGGLSSPTAAELMGCQQFTGSCTVPITADGNAYAGDGTGSIDVTYADGNAILQASAGVDVTPAAIVLHGGSPLAMPAGAGNVQVVLHNAGPFALTSPGVALQPALAGVEITDDCPELLAAGGDCNVVVHASGASVGGVLATLVPTGANVGAAPAGQSLQVQQAVVLVGTDTDGNALVLRSYDGGTSWVGNANLAPDFVGEHAVAAGTRWAVAGSRGGCQAVAYSQDLGQNWNVVTLPGAGALHAIDWTGHAFVAVGTDGGNGVIRTSADGAVWSAPVQGVVPTTLSAISCRGPECVAAGAGASLGGQTALHSLDGGNVWAPLTDTWLPPGFGGTLWAAGNNGNTWLLGGTASGGALALLPSQGNVAGPYDTVGGVLAGTGTVRAVASGSLGWLAVGGGSGQLVLSCAAATADAWPNAAISLGGGTLYGVVATQAGWMAVGDDGSAGVIRSSSDGASWTTQAPAGVATLKAIAVAH